MAQVEFEFEVQSAVVGPLERGPVELDVAHVVGDKSESLGFQ